MTTRRQQAIRHAVRDLVPLAPYADVEPILAHAVGPGLRSLPPSTAAWLAVTSWVRHAHTDYDRLLYEGYDRDSARFFVRDAMEEMLTSWGCRRAVPASGDDEEDAA